MPLEIERKFLVCGDSWRDQGEAIYFSQAYLHSDEHNTVRVRIAGDLGTLTVKGPTEGMRRLEFEYEIPLDDAKQVMKLCPKSPVEKYRTKISDCGVVWEIDEFTGSNQGLILAEVELESEQQGITLPDWVGEEVTEDPRYYNSNLALNPFPFRDGESER